MVKAGMPGLIWTWTSTARASIPSKATVVTRANMPTPPVWRALTLVQPRASSQEQFVNINWALRSGAVSLCMRSAPEHDASHAGDSDHAALR